MSQDSSNRFERPLRVELRPSRLLLWVALALYLAAAVAALRTPVPGALAALLGLHFGYLYCTHIANCLPSAVCALSWDVTRGWRIRQARGDWLPAIPLPPVFVTWRLVAVRFRTGRFACRTALVVAERCDADDFRRLRVRLLQSAYGNRNRAKIPGA